MTSTTLWRPVVLVKNGGCSISRAHKALVLKDFLNLDAGNNIRHMTPVGYLPKWQVPKWEGKRAGGREKRGRKKVLKKEGNLSPISLPSSRPPDLLPFSMPAAQAGQALTVTLYTYKPHNTKHSCQI